MIYTASMRDCFLFLFLVSFFSCTPRYERSLYKHWIDSDGDCQNTRAEILIQSSLSDLKFKRVSGFFPPAIADLGRRGVIFPNGKKVKKACNISHGKWYDPYSGQYFTKASDLQIDHIVPLKHAHDMGGSHWSFEKRREFANDFENLVAVSGQLNQEKSAQGPDQWMPPNQKFWCLYLSKWLKIKEKYHLDSTQAESFFIKKTLNKLCH